MNVRAESGPATLGNPTRFFLIVLRTAVRRRLCRHRPVLDGDLSSRCARCGAYL